MTFSLVLPALIVVLLGSAAGLVRWPLAPRTAVWTLTTIAAVSAAAVLFVAAVGVLGVLARSAVVLSIVEWCPWVPPHHEIGFVDGVASFAVVAASTWRARGVLRDRRRAAAGTAGRSLSFLETAEPIAFAVPGKPGCVVVSQGMLDALRPDERRVLFAHERAHLDQHHHRYLVAAELAVAILPLLRPLAEQIRLATERCADEAAAAAVGGDRRLVARSIARAAVRTSEFRVVSAFGGASVPSRVEALIRSPPPPLKMRAAGLGATAVVVAVAAGETMQIHHVAELVEHLCH